MKGEYVPIYRCRLCGFYCAGGVKLTKGRMMEAARKIVRRDKFEDPFFTHYCKDGSVGIADIQGYMLIKEDVNHGEV